MSLVNVTCEHCAHEFDAVPEGGHRVACGDSTDPQVLSAAFGDIKQARMAFTDPPWNVDYGANPPPNRWRPEAVGSILNDDLSEEGFAQLMSDAANTLAARVVGDVYVVMGAKSWPTVDAALRQAGHKWSSTIVWNKDTFVLGRSQYHRKYEPMWYGWHKDRTSSFIGKRDECDVWDYARPKASPEHPHMKPVALAARSIQNSSLVNDVVFDGFLGSGTTLLAAHQLGRVCVGVELDPRYVDVIVRRFEEATGKKGVRA